MISEWNSPPSLLFLYRWNAVSGLRPSANRCDVSVLSENSLPLAVSKSTPDILLDITHTLGEWLRRYVLKTMRFVNTYGCLSRPGRTDRAWDCCSPWGRLSATSSLPRILCTGGSARRTRPTDRNICIHKNANRSSTIVHDNSVYSYFIPFDSWDGYLNEFKYWKWASAVGSLLLVQIEIIYPDFIASIQLPNRKTIIPKTTIFDHSLFCT